MINKIKQKIYKLLKVSEKYTKTDMVYLAKGGFWLTAGQMVSSICSFLLAIAFANLLPRETYGVYKYILSIASLLAIPTLSGIDTAITQAVSRGYEGSFIKGIKTKIYWGLLGGLASLILAVYYYFNNNITLAFAFLIVGIFVPFMDSLLIYNTLLFGKKKFKISTRYNIIIQILSFAIMISVLFLTNNIFLIVFACFLSNTLFRSLFLFITIKKFKPNKKKDPKTIPYGKHLSLINVILTIADQLDKILIFHYLGAIELAIYTLAIAPPVQIRKLCKNITTLAFPKLAQHKISEIKNTLPIKIFIFFLVMIPIVIIYILIAPYLYKFIFPQYTEAIFYSQIFVLVLLLYPKGLMMTIFTTHLHKKKIYFISTIMPLIRIGLLLILLPLYGILGTILAIIGTELISLILLIFLFRKL